MSNLAGTTWIFKDTISLSPSAGCEVSSGNTFYTSGNINGVEISVSSFGLQYEYEQNIGGNISRMIEFAYTTANGWDNDTYKTITFTAEPTSFGPNESTFMAWLRANAAKQREEQSYLVTETELAIIADAIRMRAGLDEQLAFPSAFVSAVNNIEGIRIGEILDKTISSVSSDTCSVVNPYTFQYCYSLKTVYLPMCASIGDHAFQGCPISSCVLSSALTSVGSYAFANTGLSFAGVDLTSVSFIAEGAFQFCPITSISPTVVSIATNGFNGCSIPEVNLSGLTYVGASGLRNNAPLSIFSAPLCHTIQNNAFEYCPNLTTVYAPNCTTLGDGAFARCTSLSDVTLTSCTSLPTKAFSSCANLETISLPNCSKIGVSAFYSCKKLSAVFLTYSQYVTLSSSAFSNTPMVKSSFIGAWGSIYVPSSMVETYKTMQNWSLIANRITALTT